MLKPGQNNPENEDFREAVSPFANLPDAPANTGGYAPVSKAVRRTSGDVPSVGGPAPEQRLRTSLAALGKGTWDWDVLSGQMQWDDLSYRLMGWQPVNETRSYRDFERTVHPEHRVTMRREVRKAIAENRPFEIEFPVSRPDAGLYWLLSEGSVLERDGYGRPLRVTGILYDITSRKHLETEEGRTHGWRNRDGRNRDGRTRDGRTRDGLALRAAARPAELRQMNSSPAAGNSALEEDITHHGLIPDIFRYMESLLEQAHNAVTLRDMEDRILFWNHGAELCYGWPGPDAAGRNIHELLQTAFPEPPARVQGDFENLGFWEGELRRLRRDHSPVRVLSTWTLQRDASGKPAAILEINSDITARRTVDDAPRMLLQRTLDTQERERLHLAHELHDHVGQGLMALLMGLKALPDLPDPGLTPPSVNTRIQNLQDLALDLVEQVSHLSGELRPAVLDTFGLASALRQYVADWQKSTGISAHFHAQTFELPLGLPSTAETTLYRIVQEALTNVQHHAHAHQVNVLLQKVENFVVLVVEDDGRGFNVDALRHEKTGFGGTEPSHETSAGAGASAHGDAGGRTSPARNGTGIAAYFEDGNEPPQSKPLRDAPARTEVRRGLGLCGMSERVKFLSGIFAVESAPEAGTTIFVRVPLDKQPAPDTEANPGTEANAGT